MAPSAAHQPPKHLGIGVGLALVVTVIVLAFSWPAVTADPRNVPLAITGPEEQVAAVSAALDQHLGDAVALTTVADRDAAVRAVERRAVYGAIVLGPDPEVLKATAASPVAAQLVEGTKVPLGQLLAAMTQTLVPEGNAGPVDQAGPAPAADQAAVTVLVTDVVPLLEADSRGSGLAAATLPLVLGGLVGGVAISLLVVGIWRRIAALAVYAVAAGLLITGVLQTWFGVLAGAYLANAAVFTACLLAIGSTIVGFASLLGRPGIPVGPVLFLLVANPIAGVTMPPEFLPTGWGTIGQLFPPGAGATLVRNVSYFPDASTTAPWLVLTGWTVLGLALATLAHRRAPRTEPATAPAA
ncbi:MAG: hypothetical protein FWH11_05290 [Micrococcales bacterium]|nr:hypothetical protein [Micrococcales bacterium]